MSADDLKSSQEFVQESTAEAAESIDFDFLATQTFADVALEREVLELFVAQARRLLPALATLPPGQQADTAHLLKGSARGIGAWRVADIAGRYEAAVPALRETLHPQLRRAMAAAEHAIARRLAAMGA